MSLSEVRNSRVTKPSYANWRHTLSYELGNFYRNSSFELLTRLHNKFLFFYFRVTNSKVKHKIFHFELLTWRSNFYSFTSELLTRSWKIKMLHFEFLTRSQKIKKFTIVELFLFHFRVSNSKFKNKKFHFELVTQWVHFYFLIFELRTWSW